MKQIVFVRKVTHLSETEWLKRPVFSEDGNTWYLEKYREVPKGSLIVVGTISFEDMKATYWHEK